MRPALILILAYRLFASAFHHIQLYIFIKSPIFWAKLLKKLVKFIDQPPWAEVFKVRQNLLTVMVNNFE